MRRESGSIPWGLNIRTLSNPGAGLGGLLWIGGSQAESERLLEETDEAQRRVLGEDHADTLRTHRELGWIYYQRGRFEESAELLVDVVANQNRVLGQGHPDTLKSMNALSGAYYGLRRYAEPEALMRGLRAMISCAIVALTGATGLMAREESTAGGEEEGGQRRDHVGSFR